MIILITKSFADKKYNNSGKGKRDNRSRGGNRKFQTASFEDLSSVTEEDQAKKNLEDLRKRRRGSRQERRFERAKARVDKIDLEIATIKKNKEAEEKQSILENLKHPKPTPPPPDTRNRFEKLRDSAKSKVSDSKFKKGLKYTVIGTGLAAGTAAVYGGIKLKKKIDQRKSEKKIKDQIIGEDKKESKK